MGNSTVSNNEYGRIEFVLDKTKYVAGDQVNGKINVNIIKQFPSNQLYLLIEGKESTQLMGSENIEESEGK